MAVEGEVAIITRGRVEEADYNLSPSRWVGVPAGGGDADVRDIVRRFESVIAEEAAVSADLRTVLQRLKGLA